VNFSTYTPSEAALFLMATEPPVTPNPAVIAAGWQDFFSEEMDRAIGLQEESFDLVTRAQSQMAQFIERDGWLTPALTGAFELTAQMVQMFVELQRSWAAILTASSPAMALPVASTHHLATLPGKSASGACTLQMQGCSEEEYARSMDIALGERIA
jgi:hypothetical protein